LLNIETELGLNILRTLRALKGRPNFTFNPNLLYIKIIEVKLRLKILTNKAGNLLFIVQAFGSEMMGCAHCCTSVSNDICIIFKCHFHWWH
jgi:hypothetical protein